VTRRTVIAIGLACAVAACATALARSQGNRSSAQTASVSSLRLITVPTPLLPVPRYDTSGSIPKVSGSGIDLQHVNASLREAVLRDQRAYEPNARASAKHTGSRCRGTYSLVTDRRLLSASSVVVSALLPATKLYPCGNEGQGWVSVTVRVPSGKQVTLAQLFRDPEGDGLFQLGVAWFRVIARDSRLNCVVSNLSSYQPTLRNYRYFALTPHGLALGFRQEPACQRIVGIVPYRALQPYLSNLGKQLVAGVRRPG